ncbi:hypothetical protein [Pantoea stewartii]|uniref:Transposase n=1 Tax=Pantoea stewartii subsp. stewartii DC283 TaxID=660596 RepID=A0ABM6K913_PANSE|nr:hypothetical protein [Pantoea stewartii]ARF50936.1 hypothetical protein DSJ_17425 [Pantoea stewartii subsp. stewartii DC283]KAB0560031.1 hypothetical protein F7Q90_00020 [Pantoea stewartii subsp. stewartii]
MLQRAEGCARSPFAQGLDIRAFQRVWWIKSAPRQKVVTFVRCRRNSFVSQKTALLNKWILCCGTMKTVVSDNIKSMHYMLAYDGVLSGISVFYQNSADKTE